LAAASATAELLVIGRRAGQEDHQLILGSRARQLIDTAQCPVLVAGPTETGMGNGHTRSAATSGGERRSSASSPH